MKLFGCGKTMKVYDELKEKNTEWKVVEDQETPHWWDEYSPLRIKEDEDEGVFCDTNLSG